MAVTRRKVAAVGSAATIALATALYLLRESSPPTFIAIPTAGANDRRLACGLAPIYFPGEVVDGRTVPVGYALVIDSYKDALDTPSMPQTNHGSVWWHYLKCTDAVCTEWRKFR